MGEGKFDHEVERIAQLLPAGPRLAIIGGTSFWHADSPATCAAIGSSLAKMDALVLLTGGVAGIGEAVGRAFFGARDGLHGHRSVFHILPHGHSSWDYGETLSAGSTMEERREILGRLADIYEVIEGGPGTAHEASVAQSRAALVIPVGRSGGAAGELYARNHLIWEGSWAEIGRSKALPYEVALAVTQIALAHLNKGTRPNASVQ